MLLVTTTYQQTACKITTDRSSTTPILLKNLIARTQKYHYYTLLYSGKSLQKEKLFHLFAWQPLAFVFADALFDYQNNYWYNIASIDGFMRDFLNRNQVIAKKQKQLSVSSFYRHLPFAGGLLGMCSFESKNILEEKKLYQKKSKILPDFCFVLYAKIEVYLPHLEKKILIEQNIASNYLPPITDKTAKKKQ